jgi:hypothetical protein
MPAAMMDMDRMFAGDLVEVADVELAAVLQLGVVVIIAMHPGARRQGSRLGLELFDDAVDGDELDLIGIADQHFIKQRFAIAVIVRVGEARRDEHALGVVDAGLRSRQGADVRRGADGGEAPGPHGKGLGLGPRRIHGDDAGIDDDQVGRGVFLDRPGRRQPGRPQKRRATEAGGFQEDAAVLAKRQ